MRQHRNERGTLHCDSSKRASEDPKWQEESEENMKNGKKKSRKRRRTKSKGEGGYEGMKTHVAVRIAKAEKRRCGERPLPQTPEQRDEGPDKPSQQASQGACLVQSSAGKARIQVDTRPLYPPCAMVGTISEYDCSASEPVFT